MSTIMLSARPAARTTARSAEKSLRPAWPGQPACGAHHAGPAPRVLGRILATGTGEHAGKLGRGEPPRVQRDDQEHQVGRVEVRVQDALALGGRIGLRLALVVRGPVGLVGDRAAGQALPQQQADELGMSRVVVVGAPGELPDVLQAVLGPADRDGELFQFVGEHRLEQRLLVAEVFVQAFLVDPGAFGDAGHGRTVGSALGELGRRRLLQAAACALGVPGHEPSLRRINPNVAVGSMTRYAETTTATLEMQFKIEQEGTDMAGRVPGGTLPLADDLNPIILSRMGYGAMQLAGPGVFGPPRDRDQALKVLREAVELGLTHIDTSDFYGPAVVNELIREALYPYPADLRIVTKVGARRGPDGSWRPSQAPADLVAQVHENLKHLALDALDVVNLRLPEHGGRADELAEPFGALAELQKAGLIRHLGLSAASAAQLDQAQAIAPVVTVQNLYNVAARQDDALVDRCAAEHIAYAPFFPLGGFTPLQSRVLAGVAARLGASPHQVALAWLLQRSPTIVLIPGTSSLAHLRENVAAADLVLPADAVAELDTIGG